MSSSLIAEPKPLPGALCAPDELLPFARVKLIVFDLDGTLIGRPDEALGPRLAQLFEAVAGSSVLVALATGRTLLGVTAVLGQLRNLNRVPLVLYNGSVVLNQRERPLIAHCAIPPLAAQQVQNLVQDNHGISAFFYCVDPEPGLMGINPDAETVFFAGSSAAPSVDSNGMPILLNQM